MKFEKMERYLQANLLGLGPRLMKKNLPGRGLTKVEKHCSMGALLGEPGRGALLLGAQKVTKGRFWGWASLFMGAQLGNLEWAYLPGTLR